MPAERIFQGAWKIPGDGSPQGYTAWLKSPGYYDWRAYTAEQSATWNARMYSGDPAGALVGTKYHDPDVMVGPDGTIENVPPGDMHYIIRLLHKYGLSTEVHTNGTVCAEVWLEAMEMAVTENPEIKDTRHTSIHSQTLERQHLQRMVGDYDGVDTSMFTQMWGYFTDEKYRTDDDPASRVLKNSTKEELAARMRAQNFFPSFFINLVLYFGERHSNIFFGPGRARNISPVGLAIAYGMPFSFHNDTYVTPIEPLTSVKTAVTRLSAKTTISDGGVLISGSGKDLDAKATYPSRAVDGKPVAGTEMSYYDYDQCINVLQAFVGVTVGPAWQNKLESRIGSIKEGLNADFVILDDDPMAVAESDATKIASIRVGTTIVGDRPVYGVLPDASSYLFAVHDSYLPGTNTRCRISGIAAEYLDGAAASGKAALDDGVTRLGMVRIKAYCSSGDNGVLQMSVLGNGATAGEIQLRNVATGAMYTY